MIVNTPLGKMIASEAGSAGQKVYRFLSIPYARAGRFEPPVRIDDYPAGHLINSEKSYCFPQRAIPALANIFLKHHMMRAEFLTNQDIQTEDAFMLNVWTSDLDTIKPVLVYIHGGGDYGSGTSPIYDGAHLAAQNIVVVTINYRIGFFGYLPVYDGDKLRCNCAALDQQAALQWVKRNIGFLGGDKENICLMGQSGGSMSALNQFLNPHSSQLFHRLILCGGPLPTAISQAGARDIYKQTIAANGLKNLHDLKALPPQKLVRLKAKNSMNDIIDGKFFTKDPKEILAYGEFPKIPILVGANGDEFSMIEMPMFYKAMGIAVKEKNLKEALSHKYGTYADLLVQAIAPEAADIVDLQIKILELIVFHSTSLKLMTSFSRKCPVYGYRFCYVPNLYHGLRGAYHGAEIAMFFNNLDKMKIEITEQNRKEVRTLQKDWLSFVKTGQIPNRPLFDERQEITLYDAGTRTIPFPHASLLAKVSDTNLYEKAFGDYLKNR
ncbi:MAG: carboxylesterase family protein [Lachnospiraceae bacterium]